MVSIEEVTFPMCPSIVTALVAEVANPSGTVMVGKSVVI